MVHLVARAVEGSVLFRTHAEARALFDLVADAFPDLVAVCVMPDHVHLVVPAESAARWRWVLSAYARWRNAHRRERGPVWAPAPAPEPLPDAKHLRRTIRYVHLNPCRAELVGDPLAWPWSAHRDAVGLAVPAVRPREDDPARHHAWISGDPTVAVQGTTLPEADFGETSWEQVAAAASAVCRVPVAALRARGKPRTLAIRAAWLLEATSPKVLASVTGAHLATVYRLGEDLPARSLLHREPELLACVRVVGDPRFEALPDGDLRLTPAWRRYRHRR